MAQKQILPSKTARHFSNNTKQFSFDAELYQSGKNKVPFMHFHDFYEFSIYLGKKPAGYRLFGQEYEVSFGDIVRCDLMDEHMWLLDDNAQGMRFTAGLTSSYVMSSSTVQDNLLQIFSRNGSSYPVLSIGALNAYRYIDLINDYQNCSLKHGKLVYQLGILHQMLAFLQDDFMEISSASDGSLTRQDNLVCELVNYINQHVGEDLSLENLGRITNYNPTYLSRTFKRATGNTLKSYIDEKRVQTAVLMIGKGMTLSEIAAEVGFQNYCTFYNVFRRIVGQSPESYHKVQETGGNGDKSGRLMTWDDPRMRPDEK